MFAPPIADDFKSMDCLRKALDIEPDNLDALLVLSRMQDLSTMVEGVSEDVFEKLSQAQTDNPEYRSMLAFAKAWYYESKDMTQEYVQELKRSIQYFPGHVLNHISLSIYYKDHGQEEKSRYHRVQGIDHIDPESDTEDRTDVQFFIRERIKGRSLIGTISK
ncbi:hypothetical protein [Paludifilum halophilum]|uniref:Uncharacterized protein n=1 Tax=Paludifilum halophilum TaxID=1642702 RepID=A0A235B2L0_9BACL|nr:hypothetical protein [Paludifilum halophilum]OYD06536.1 hypothetical protein CHM34_15675 [Paludifilum halophilum]